MGEGYPPYTLIRIVWMLTKVTAINSWESHISPYIKNLLLSNISSYKNEYGLEDDDKIKCVITSLSVVSEASLALSTGKWILQEIIEAQILWKG